MVDSDFKKRVLIRTCSECGKSFQVVLYDDDSYCGGSYYGDIKIGIGDWAVSEFKDGEFINCISIWEYIYYKLRDMKRLLLKQYDEEEIWVCNNCENFEWECSSKFCPTVYEKYTENMNFAYAKFRGQTVHLRIAKSEQELFNNDLFIFNKDIEMDGWSEGDDVFPWLQYFDYLIKKNDL